VSEERTDGDGSVAFRNANGTFRDVDDGSMAKIVFWSRKTSSQGSQDDVFRDQNTIKVGVGHLVWVRLF
jgi:hypothetical protein